VVNSCKADCSIAGLDIVDAWTQKPWLIGRTNLAYRSSPNKPFLELYRRKALAAARRRLAIISARWLMKVHHSLATYHGAADMNKRCAMWLPTFLQHGIHFCGERTEVFAFNNFVIFDRVHRPIIGKRAGVVEEDLLSMREAVRANTGIVMKTLGDAGNT
jgi:hypothetical protein